MSIDKTKLINVLNYNMNPIAISTHLKEYLCAPAVDEDTPSITPLSLSEIESMGTKDLVFKIGLLSFPEDIQKEIYEEHLRMTDWENILTNKQIKEIILNPSPEGLSKIIAIKNSAYMERVRGIFFMLKNSNAYDISHRVEIVINRRYKELSNQQVKTSIELTQKDNVKPSISKEEVNLLKEQNDALQSQIEAMQKMMEQMMAMQNQKVQATTTETPVKEEVKKQVGNKPANKK